MVHFSVYKCIYLFGFDGILGCFIILPLSTFQIFLIGFLMLITNLAIFLYYKVIFMVPHVIITSFLLFFSIVKIICNRSMGFVSIDAEWSISYLSLTHYLIISA